MYKSVKILLIMSWIIFLSNPYIQSHPPTQHLIVEATLQKAQPPMTEPSLLEELNRDLPPGCEWSQST